LVSPIWLPVFFLLFYNEPELGVGINPGMDLTPLPSSIGRGSNPTSDREPSAPPLDLSAFDFYKDFKNFQARQGRAFRHLWHMNIFFLSVSVQPISL